MRIVKLDSCLSEEEADRFVGRQLALADARLGVFRESVTVFKPDGEPLAIYLRRAIPEGLCLLARDAFRNMNTTPRNRGIAAMGGSTPRHVTKDGRVSNYHFLDKQDLKRLGLDGAVSGIAGFMDRYTRYPFCRLTAFNIDQAAEFASAMPFILAVNEQFREHVPERYGNQVRVIEETNPDFVIPGTAFTTITVNKNFATRCHKDAGDLKEGFGVMSCVRSGSYQGGVFVMPRYGVGFDMGNGDVLLADVHEWHGNTPIKGRGRYERLTFVFYYRERMRDCGSAAEELARAKSGLRTTKDREP